MPIIHHLTTPEVWNAAQTTGEYIALSLATEGFVHCADAAAQILGAAGQHQL